ncbi:insulinase family protein [Mucilaginibacter robiniae]|uniref:Insulinase family protein n=1 Tax=Mucilaginibacter robiniae TaxID=2728022 RepID=A0A7L5E220_9SPHI|nr:pitrilysin family protein [Mucilaginibacter robiniae]QJD97410.1 insulinase family protein [Mucilaginibacter robiniae]
MKKILAIAAGAILLQQAQAQTIDRTHQPAPGPAPVITFKDPVTYKLSNGITVLIVEDHKLPHIDASFYVDAGPRTEGNKAGVLNLMGQMLNEGTTNMPKAQFDEAVDKLGASVSLTSTGGSVDALTRYFPEAFTLMSKALETPAMTQASFDKLQSQYLTGLKSNEKNATAISGRVVNALAYGKNNPMGEFETETTVKNLTLADVKSAYMQYITPSRSYLTIIGDIKSDAAKALVEKTFGSWKGGALTLPTLATVPNPAATEIDVINMPTAVQSNITVTNLVSLGINEPDYFAVQLANIILGGGSDAYLFKALREKRGFTYGAYSNIGGGKYQTAFKASAAVRTAKTDSAVTEFLTQINRIRSDKVSAEELQNAKALYNGSFALNMENPSATASYARNILINDLPKDYYRTYLQRINAVTAEDVQRVAQKYFNYGNTRVVIVGNASQFMPGLQKLGFPVKTYDTYANPVTAQPTAAVPAGLKATDVLNNYISAVGGSAELKKVKSVSSTGTMQMQGMNLAVQTKNMVPNKELMTVSMGSNTLMKRVFNGTTGYQQQISNKLPMTADEIKEKNVITGLFEQLNYVSNPAFKTELKGVEKVNNADAYKVSITSPTGKTWNEYFDTNTKLLVRQEETQTQNNVVITTTVDMGDYKKVNGVMYPFSQTITNSANNQQQVLDLKINDVKVNEGVTAADFQ